MPTISDLRERRLWPLDKKIEYTSEKIREWYDYWEGRVYVSFSKGKDSTVLLDIVRKIYPEVPAVYVNTGLDYPEVRQFGSGIPNVITLRPEMPFHKVIERYGYPVISKKISRFLSDLQNASPKNAATRNLRLTGYNRKGTYCPSMKLSVKWLRLIDASFKISDRCCLVLKEDPLKKYVKATKRHGITGVMAAESNRREKDYLKKGCNVFGSADPLSSPLGFWDEQDALLYIKERELPIASVYGNVISNGDGSLRTTGEKRTGCMFCMFGVHLEKGFNRFERMSITHPHEYEYCINKLGIGKVLDFIGVNY